MADTTVGTAPSSIALDNESMLAWATSMVEPLRSRAAAAERERELPAATIEEASAAGFIKLLLPSELGGPGLGLDTVAEATRTLANGCVSSAWTLSFLTLHNWFIARGPRELQTAVFADRGVAHIPCPLAPTGTARPVDGGFVVSGRWEWATGIQHADWVMVNTLIAHDDGPPEPRFVVVPRDEVEVDDVWHTSGMRATGSHTVHVEDLFVPRERTISSGDFRSTEPPGAALSDSL